MLTNNILSYYNHLIATTVLYVTLVNPMQELVNSLKQNTDSGYNHVPLMVSATEDVNQDYYEILGVKKDATKHEIHKAFRHMAKKYHPDKNKEKGAQDEFIKIFKAYETLSDEKKRKEYDDRSNASSNGSFNGWHSTNGMNDFDMNDFFKQYEDQLFRHAQHFTHHHEAHQQNINNHHHHQHHDHHNRFSFHGVNLDDLFHDIDEDEFSSFGRMFGISEDHLHNDLDGSFGDGASFFGSHIPSQLHDTLHRQNFHQHHSSGGSGASYSCHTTTKQVNGMVMTQTSCG